MAIYEITFNWYALKESEKLSNRNQLLITSGRIPILCKYITAFRDLRVNLSTAQFYITIKHCSECL